MAHLNKKCPDCGGVRFVEDHAAGDIVCQGCGLVVEEHIIDERSEWRTFSDKDKESVDPNRVGGPSNPLLDGGGLSTVIGKIQGDGGMSFGLNRMHTRSNNPDRNLLSAFKKISSMSEQLSLSMNIKDRACELYKEAMETGLMKGKGMQAVAAGCLYLACRQENNPRTFKEITAVLPPEVQKRDIGRCFKDIVQAFKDKAAAKGDAAGQTLMQTFLPTAHPAHYVKRYTAELKLGHAMFKACQDMALAANPKDTNGVKQDWDSRSPVSVAAAIIFIISQLAKDPKDRVHLQQISIVMQVGEATIKAAYRDLYPELSRLVPKYHASPEAILALPPPPQQIGLRD